MIDLHCHVLPGIDDGPNDMDGSLRMAQTALDDGIHTIVATPHVDLRYGAEPDAINPKAEELRTALAREGLSLSLLAGAEIALSRLSGLDDAQIRTLCLGDSMCALVESPYRATGSLIEESLFDLQVRGFRPLLAHPERCPEFQRDVPRLQRLVEAGVACSISAGSLVGQFGDTVRRSAYRLLERELVHNVSSDAHDALKRPPALRAAVHGLKSPRASTGLRLWLTSTVPAALLSDQPLPPRPPLSRSSRSSRSSRWRR